MMKNGGNAPTFEQRQADVCAVTQVVLRERQARDRGWWGQMEQTYWPDSRVKLSWFDGDGPTFTRKSEVLYERGVRPWHRAFAPVASLVGHKAHVEVPTMIVTGLEVKGRRARLSSFARLNYRLEKREGEWRISSFQVVYEYAEICSAVPGEAIDIPLEELSAFRPTYDLLSWSIAQRGMEVSHNELGDDRPEELKVFYDDIREWLNA